MKNGAKYEHLGLQELQALLDKKYSQLALMANNKFNLELKCEELNVEVSELRKEIARKNQKLEIEKQAEQAQAKKQEKKQTEKGKEMTKPMNNVISMLGVQGLSRNNYSVVQLKVVLAIIGHAQKVIKDYVVDGQMPNKSMRKRLTAKQMTDGYVVVVIRLSDLCAHTSRYSQVKNAIGDMAKRKPITIP